MSAADVLPQSPQIWYESIFHPRCVRVVPLQLVLQDALFQHGPLRDQAGEEDGAEQPVPRTKQERRGEGEEDETGVHRVAYVSVGSCGHNTLRSLGLDSNRG